jgi:hypothetical protein
MKIVSQLPELPEKEPGRKSRTLAGASCGLSQQGCVLSRLSRDALRPTLAGVSYMLSQLFSLLESSITCTVHPPCGGRPVRGAARVGRQLQKQPWAVTTPVNSLVRLKKTCHGSAEIAGTIGCDSCGNRRSPVTNAVTPVRHSCGNRRSPVRQNRQRSRVFAGVAQ